MAENGEHGGEEESFMEKIAEKLHLKHEEHHEHQQEQEQEHEHEHEHQEHHEVDSSSSSFSSDSEHEKPKETSSASASAPATAADVFLWRNKKISASVLATGTAIWVLFELLEYHLLTLVCHILIFTLAILFLWANASTFINKSPPHIPEVNIPERPVLEFVSALRHELNRGLAMLNEIATGKDLKKFLGVIADFVLLHTVPVLYEKYEDKVDAFAEKAMGEVKKYYGIVNKKYLSKIPRGPLKSRKAD